MRIYSMTATFGKLEHETLMLQPGLNIIEAPNEWGKSTWCAFIVAMLYGIETRVHSTKTVLADKERYAPWSGSPMSGRMDICWNGRDITIERASRGRSVFGVFRAYETESGLTVPELTADNCGQALLGVEKSVFTRSAFLKLTDLPVTEDKALWRRLNQLVTTGDESGAADALDQKLRDLKNRCRANRANGLIPLAQAEQQQLSQSLEQLEQLKLQSQRIQNRQEILAAHTEKLKNHRAALEYAAARDYEEKAAAARHHLKEVQDRVCQMEAACADLPSADQLYQNLHKAQQLRQQRESLQMEVQMQPGAPVVPETPAPFRGCTPEQAVQQAKEDSTLYEQCQQKKPSSTWLFILGFCVTGTGLVSLALISATLPVIALIAAGVLLAGIGLIYHNGRQRKYQQLQQTAQRLLDQYRPFAPDCWLSTAEDFARQQQAYEEAMARYAGNLSHIKGAMEQVNRDLSALTGDRPYLQWEQTQKDALEQHKLLSDALRELRQTEAVTQALHRDTPAPQPPKMLDSLTYTETQTARLLSDAELELRQLQLQLGRCHGQMESLGQEAQLRRQLDAVNARLEKLNETYAALELAQQTVANASAQLQRRFAPRLSKRAQEVFSKLTDQRYDRLTMGEDLGLMVGAQQEDTLRSSLWRSDGTVDQLYLALRLAVAQELTPNTPLVLDDALVRFDDKRLAAAMEILKEESAKKQVILFTCQSRETAHQ